MVYVNIYTGLIHGREHNSDAERNVGAEQKTCFCLIH